MLRVRVLGELVVERDGVQLTPPRRRPARALLGWLALHPGVHARSTVAGRLWPNVLDESARTSLRTSLSALRAVIGEEALPATREHIGLSDDVVVDWREFERMMAANRPLDAVELSRGDLLNGLDEDWVLVARDEHRERVAEALAALATGAAAQGDHDAALGFARRRARLDPLDEPAHRDLMRLLAGAGDSGGALVAYERFAERLRRELGVPAAPATRSLAAELRGGAGAAAPPPVPARIVAVCRRGRLVGRDAELARLRAVWARSAREGRRLVLVSGEPGIGKTRLVSEFAAELAGHGAVVLYGRAEEEALVPYQPLVESLREPLRHGVELPAEARELSALLPEMAGPPPGLSTAAQPPAGAQLRLFESFGAALDAVAVGRPALLVLEDLHWAEAPTIRLLRTLATRPAGAPRMLVATYRDTETHSPAEELTGLSRELPVERIALAGLSLEAVGTLLGGGRSPEAIRTLHDQTRGNPFFIEQLLPGEATGMNEAVRRRVGALGAEAHAVLDAAAVSGAEFELAVVAEVVGLPVDATLDVLEAAVRGRLIGEVPDEPGRFAFVHAIVRDTLVDSLTAARRARLHELFAEALEQRAECKPQRYLVALAHHALEAASGAGDPIRAAGLAEKAASAAGAVLAYEDAAALLRRAGSMLERRGGAVERRAEIQCALGETLQRAGLGDEAGQALLRASKLARAAGRSDLVARSALGFGGVGVTILGADPGLVSKLEQALAAIGPDHPELRVRLLARLAIELAYEPDPARREALSTDALALARRTGDPAALAAALSARHVTVWGPDGCRERLRLAGEMLALADQAGDRELALQARNWRVVDLLELGDGQAVREELDAYAELSVQARLPAFAWYVPLWRATLALLEGRITEAIELSRRACDLGRQAGDANAAGFFAEQVLLRMVVQRRVRDLDPIDAGAEVDVAARAHTGPAWRAFRFTFAWWHAEREELDQAREDFESAVADGLSTLPRDVNWLAALTSATEACVLIGDLARARELRTLLEPYATRMAVTARGASHGGSVAYLIARLAALCGDHTTADQMFAEAQERDDRAGAPAFVLRDLCVHESFLRASGRHAHADKVRRRAADLALSLGLDDALGGDPRHEAQTLSLGRAQGS
jgi:DNA-binding SARP family transcriptional activator/tetratricopeptide (TPR) repeat protein